MALVVKSGKSRVTVTDKGLNELLRVSNQRSLWTVGVGRPEAKKTYPREEGPRPTVGEVAAYNEFGIGVPERSWLRGWIDQNRGLIEQEFRSAAELALHGKDINAALAPVMEGFVESIKARIEGGIAPANKEKTVDRKGSLVPLIDSRLFIDSIKARQARQRGGR